MIKVYFSIFALLVLVSAVNSPMAAPPPLKVDKDKPLLLDEPPADSKTSATQAAQAAATPKLICYDCHGNYREESLAVKHASVGVTCVKCHGESREHTGDEANVTPPQIMYPRDAIALRCKMCHSAHDAAPAKVIERWQQRGLEKIAPRDLVCTDCHGDHRLKVRTVRWDKKTGKLLPPETKGKK